MCFIYLPCKTFHAFSYMYKIFILPNIYLSHTIQKPSILILLHSHRKKLKIINLPHLILFSTVYKTRDKTFKRVIRLLVQYWLSEWAYDYSTTPHLTQASEDEWTNEVVRWFNVEIRVTLSICDYEALKRGNSWVRDTSLVVMLPGCVSKTYL